MTTADESAAFLAAICADPADDTARLVYADWLDEHGEAERAEFIRLQMTLSHPTLGPDGTGDSVLRYHQIRLEDWLLMSYGRGWAPVWPAYISPGIYSPSHDNADEGFNLYFARGFVRQVACPAASWLAHADALHWHPTQTVGCPETLFGAAAVVHQAVACATCGGKGTVPRPCPPTAQPITHVDLTTRPTVAALVDLVRSRGLLDPGGVVLRHGAKDVLQMCFPGIAFTLPGPS